MDKKAYIVYKDVRVPLKLKREWRTSVRYSISKKSVNLTIPKYYTRDQLEDEYYKMNEWAEKQFAKNPDMLERFIPRRYTDQESFRIYGNDFTLHLRMDDRKGLSGVIEEDRVIITSPLELSEADTNHSISTLLSRLFSKHFHPDVESRVMQFNDQYFQEEIKAVRLKNNQSNWGSCSTNKYINLSSRLLFAPRDVMDYVIVHELSHLKEMNHSSRFWNIVESVMPDYKSKDAWLTNHGHQLKF